MNIYILVVYNHLKKLNIFIKLLILNKTFRVILYNLCFMIQKFFKRKNYIIILLKKKKHLDFIKSEKKNDKDFHSNRFYEFNIDMIVYFLFFEFLNNENKI